MATRLRLSSLGNLVSPWRVSWPLTVGMSLFVLLLNATGLPLLADPDSRWHVAIGNGSSRTARCRTSTAIRILSLASMDRQGVSIANPVGAGRARGGWGAVAALSAASIAATFALMLRPLLRDLRPLPALLSPSPRSC